MYSLFHRSSNSRKKFANAYTDAESPVRWCSPGREGTEVKEAEAVGQGGTTSEEGGESEGKRTQEEGREAYEATPPDTPRPRADRSTRPQLPPSSDPLPPPPPASAFLRCLRLLRFGAVPAKPAGKNGVYSRTTDMRTLI